MKDVVKLFSMVCLLVVFSVGNSTLAEGKEKDSSQKKDSTTQSVEKSVPDQIEVEQETKKVIYDFEVENAAGEKVSINQYKGKVLLIVNTASKCGYTKQYEGLEKLYRQYKDQGLEILAFPCNQFGGQEPGTNKEIQEFCQTKFDVTFPVFAKIDVNGEKAHPLYKWLKSQVDPLTGGEDIKWNFGKFLVSKNGENIQRFPSSKTPEELAEKIVKLLQE